MVYPYKTLFFGWQVRATTATNYRVIKAYLTEEEAIAYCNAVNGGASGCAIT